LEFAEIYARIRQGLQERDNDLVEQGTTELLDLPPVGKILAQDLIEILACLAEVVEALFPSVAERMGNFAEKIGEMFEDSSQDEQFKDIVSNVPQGFADAHPQVIVNNIQQLHDLFLSNFANLMPKVQDAFIDYLKIGMALTSEIFETHFPEILDYIQTLPVRRLEKVPHILDCGGNLFPGEAIREILSRFFANADNSSPDQMLFNSYLGDFLLQFLDIYPEAVTEEMPRFLALLTHQELYFRSFVADILKIITQARSEIIAPYFLQIYQMLEVLDPKLLAGLILTIRDLLAAQGENIYAQLASNPENLQTFFNTSNALMAGENFEVHDFACEIFFDSLEYIAQSEQPQILLDTIHSWKNLPELSTYYVMILQNFLKNSPLVSITNLTPDELEIAENLRALLTEIEDQLVSLTKKARREFKNRGELNKYN